MWRDQGLLRSLLLTLWSLEYKHPVYVNQTVTCRVNGHLSYELAVCGHMALVDSLEATLNELASSQLIKVTLSACVSQDDQNEQLCLSTSPGPNVINGRGN